MVTRSLTYRVNAMAPFTDIVPIVIAKITHPDLAAPLLLSSDPTERLSTDPLYYGTTHLGDEYLFALMSVILPDEPDDGPAGTSLVFENVSRAFGDIMDLVTNPPPEISLYEVTSADLDLIEDSWEGLEVANMTMNADTLRVDVSYRPITQEPFPAGRMTYSTFRGLHP